MLSLVLLAVSLPAPAQEAVLGSPFSARASAPAGAALELELDEGAFAALSAVHDEGLALRLAGVPFPGGPADLALRPVSALEDGAQALVVGTDGVTRWLGASVRCFAGHVAGGGPAFLALSPTQAQGAFVLRGETFFLSSGPSAAPRGGAPWLTPASSLAAPLAREWCRVLGSEREPSSGVIGAVAAPRLRTADVFIECDDGYRALFTSDQDCLDYAVLLATAASEVYRRDLGVELRIPSGYLRVWNTPVPWGQGDVGAVLNWWNSPQNSLRGIPRAAVHVLSHPVFGGVAYLDVLCNRSFSYQLSSVFGSFPYPRQHAADANWDLLVLTHEFGHSFGSPHTFDYRPPIQDCVDGSGPDAGTIMGYCHLEPGGVANVGMRFHVRTQEHILADLESLGSCLETQLLVRGDYDGDGDRDALDVQTLEGILAQGFRSLAAEELFDMDGNGALQPFDREVLASIVRGDPPAVAEVRNGSHTNPDCLFSLETPVLGRPFTLSVFAPGANNASLLLVSDRALLGLATRFGELLVAPPLLFTSTAPTSGLFSDHVFPLPPDLGLVGLALKTQALVLRPASQYFCNALDLVFALY